MVIIRSKNFILRPFKKGDESSLVKNINDKTITRNTLRIPYPYRLKDAHSWINLNSKFNKKKNKKEINFAIDMSGMVVGSVGLSKIEDHKAEIGYWLGKKYRRQGIMTEAVKLVTKYSFDELKLKRVYAFIFIRNKISEGVVKKNGFKYEGKLKKNFKKGNK
ncbi:GNAT family N-acetyltransferase, partial [Patescibacteria group bacterium]|nr:GNAT family N-acetyltransferase [Patescibacteria group bacterium]